MEFPRLDPLAYMDGIDEQAEPELLDLPTQETSNDLPEESKDESDAESDVTVVDDDENVISMTPLD